MGELNKNTELSGGARKRKSLKGKVRSANTWRETRV